MSAQWDYYLLRKKNEQGCIVETLSDLGWEKKEGSEKWWD